MDRRGRRTALILALALSAPASAQSLQAQRWLAKGADPRVLTRLPAECLAKSANADAALSVEIGRAAFRTPTLLGGQAARAGLSCDSCHRNGRGNPDFHFPSISGNPGTADVTASLFSSHRGDGAFNPKPIPDLGGSKARLKTPQDGPALKTFIHGLIVEEFDGHEPPPRVLEGLAAYVRTLRACPATSTGLRAGDYISDALRAVGAAMQALDQNGGPTAELLISGARARLGLIAERYPDNADVTTRLLAADRELSSIREAVHTGDRSARGRLQAWVTASPRWSRSVRAAEPKSLFNPARLKP